MRRATLAAGGLAGSRLALAGPADASAWPGAGAYSADVPAAWLDLVLDLVRTTTGFSPPVAARAFGYVGVALYEAVAPGIPDRGGLSGRLNGLQLPRVAAGAAYHWPTVAGSALASIVRRLFATATPAGAAAIAELERRSPATARALPPGVARRSIALGATVAEHVFAWSTSDGGHEGYARNFPSTYRPPAGPDLWEPTPPAYARALQPYWGANRPFATPRGQAHEVSPAPVYSEHPASRFQDELRECHRVASQLTAEQERIARFWSDDPGATVTPPGHSISILTQVVRAHAVPLDRACEAYAKVGVAVADSFIACWQTKYKHMLPRPVTCIRRAIDPAWMPLLTTPPFPEYTSGHSVQSAAAALVMTEMFGALPFTDRTHESRGLAARSFPSFAAAAEEAAISRLYGGIHLRSAIEHGLEQGRWVGRQASRILDG